MGSLCHCTQEASRGSILSELHNNHSGISRMKSVARSYAWWPRKDQDIEDLVKGCKSCQSLKDSPAVAPLILGFAPANPGRGSMSTLQVPSWVKCSSSLLMHTPSGRRFMKWDRPLPKPQLLFYDTSLQHMAYQTI